MSQLTAKSQVTLSKAAREALGVKPGDAVEFLVTDGRVEVVRAETLAFDVGKGVFGRYASGVSNRSTNRKRLLAEALREKRSRR